MTGTLRTLRAGLVTLGLLSASHAQGAGFALLEQSGSGLGNAFAGGAASAEDASTVFFNPAGLSRLQGRQWLLAAQLILPSARFSNQGSTSASGAPMTGGNGGQAASSALIPNAYFTVPLSQRVRFGFGLNVPFGLMTAYEGGWVGRYHGTKSDLRTLNINPALAFQLTPRLSLGVGFNIQRAEATLQSSVDFGLLAFGPGGSQSADGHVRVDGSGWGHGYNLGLLWQATDWLRVGAHYRSKIDHSFDNGQVTFSGILAGAPPFTDGVALADITLPESASLSAYAELGQAWAVMADLSWTGWSRFRSLNVLRPDGSIIDATPQNYEDTLRYALGLSYRVDAKWKLRAGVAYDETPVQTAFRTPRVPDQSRVWLAVGAAWRPWSGAQVDLGYAHLFMDDARVDVATPAAGRLRGHYSARVDLFAVQYAQRF